MRLLSSGNKHDSEKLLDAILLEAREAEPTENGIYFLIQVFKIPHLRRPFLVGVASMQVFLREIYFKSWSPLSGCHHNGRLSSIFNGVPQESLFLWCGTKFIFWYGYRYVLGRVHRNAYDWEVSFLDIESHSWENQFTYAYIMQKLIDKHLYFLKAHSITLELADVPYSWSILECR